MSPMLRKPSSRCTLYKCIRMVCLLLTHEQSIYRSSRYYSEKFPLGSNCSLLDFPEYQERPSHKTRSRMVELVESRRSNFCKSSSMCQTSPLLTRSRLKGSWENPFSIGAICILRLFDTFWRWSKKAVFCLNVKTHIGRYGYFE